MADEIRISLGLQIIKNNLHYIAQPTAFTADLATSAPKGPTPGAILVALAGTDLDLSELTTPGWARFWNLEDDGGNFFEWGIWDGVTFYPVGEVHPGEGALFKVSQNLTEEFGTGTGTTGADINTLRLRADTAPVKALAEVFEA